MLEELSLLKNKQRANKREITRLENVITAVLEEMKIRNISVDNDKKKEDRDSSRKMKNSG
ncbi:MAG: hypothetical protein ABWW65_01850 [Thermoprotei archaeon]